MHVRWGNAILRAVESRSYQRILLVRARGIAPWLQRGSCDSSAQPIVVGLSEGRTRVASSQASLGELKGRSVHPEMPDLPLGWAVWHLLTGQVVEGAIQGGADVDVGVQAAAA